MRCFLIKQKDAADSPVFSVTHCIPPGSPAPNLPVHNSSWFLLLGMGHRCQLGPSCPSLGQQLIWGEGRGSCPSRSFRSCQPGLWPLSLSVFPLRPCPRCGVVGSGTKKKASQGWLRGREMEGETDRQTDRQTWRGSRERKRETRDRKQEERKRWSGVRALIDC